MIYNKLKKSRTFCCRSNFPQKNFGNLNREDLTYNKTTKQTTQYITILNFFEEKNHQCKNLRGMLHLNTKTKNKENRRKREEKDNCLKLDRTTNTKGNHSIDESNPKGKRGNNIFSFFLQQQ